MNEKDTCIHARIILQVVHTIFGDSLQPKGHDK